MKNQEWGLRNINYGALSLTRRSTCPFASMLAIVYTRNDNGSSALQSYQRLQGKVDSAFPSDLQSLPPDLGLLADASVLLLGCEFDSKDVPSLNGLANRGDVGDQLWVILC